MKRLILLGIGFWFGVASACGDSSDDDTGAGTGGSRTAGHAGIGGSGSSGRSGSAGRVSSAGEAGTPSRAGEGGAPSRGGEGGTPTNVAGQGGVCSAEAPLHDLADSCGLGPFGNGEYATVSTTCSFEETCKALRCGEPFSDFDASGCRRAVCTSSATCASDERCVPRGLYESTCRPSVYERCSDDGCGGDCVCSTSEDCTLLGYCLPLADYPPKGDCNVDTGDCTAVTERLFYLELESNFDGDAAAAVVACVKRLHDALAVCNGTSSAGAGGEAGRAP